MFFFVKDSNRFEYFVMIFIRQRENRKKIDTNPQASSITRKTGSLVLSLLGLDSLYSPLPPPVVLLYICLCILFINGK